MRGGAYKRLEFCIGVEELGGGGDFYIYVEEGGETSGFFFIQVEELGQAMPFYKG